MGSLTVKNIPDDQYEHLKRAANAHRRSITSELIVCLERVLLPNKIPPDERLSTARILGKRVNTSIIDAAEIDAACTMQSEAESLIGANKFNIDQISVLTLASQSGCSAYEREFVSLA